jgi:hypothetical protein
VSLFRSVQVGVLFQTFFAQEQFDEMKRKGELLNVCKPNWNICQKKRREEVWQSNVMTPT